MEYKAASIPKNYSIEWVNDLPDAVTIASCVWTLETGLVEDSKSQSGTIATIVISGGVLGTVYKVDAEATGSDGETYKQTFFITVQENIN